MKKKIIKESISEAAISPFTYIVLIDALSFAEKSKGNLSYMFPTESPVVLRSWFKKLFNSESYKKGKDSLQSISSRFYNNSSLVALYKTLNTLKSMPYSELDKEKHEKDIQKLIEKISGFIKRRLTAEDDKVIEMFLSELNHVAEKISMKIQEEVDSAAQAEEVEPSDDTKTPKVQERLKNKLRKKIKEIIRTHLMSSR
jgi:hypothetical protein